MKKRIKNVALRNIKETKMLFLYYKTILAFKSLQF